MLIINNRFLSLYDYNFLPVIEKIRKRNSKICGSRITSKPILISAAVIGFYSWDVTDRHKNLKDVFVLHFIIIFDPLLRNDMKASSRNLLLNSNLSLASPLSNNYFSGAVYYFCIHIFFSRFHNSLFISSRSLVTAG